ncbi:MAG TPA: alpha/beta fold hydrolase [Candidatus Obscuribacterales bacterium]
MSQQARNSAPAFAWLVIALILLAMPLSAQAGTLMLENGPFARTLNLPVYQWQDPQQSPKVAVIAIHGVSMHGTVFDEVARRLAADGAVVVAPDLPGYGAWKSAGKAARFNYKETEKDLCALVSAVRARYHGIPVFVAGESLGGSIAIRLAATHPDLVDGLILCAPAIKIYHSVHRQTLTDAAIALAKHDHELDMSEFIKNDYSDDAAITEEEMHDPLVRKQLGMDEVLSTCEVIATTERYIKKIAANVPVLVLQGQKDQMVKPVGVKLLISHLKTQNKSVRVFPDRGHILIETKHVRPDTMSTILSWVNSQCALIASARP